ncbi:MAG: hypothetical protein KOO60_13765 [Gemmatimonadales bacterium]|nr:hypothetical protein [Gemmatimonadales bacterium]
MDNRTLLHLRTRTRPSTTGSGAIRQLREFCSRITPAWEWGVDGLFLDMTGTERLYGRGLDGLVRVCRDACGHMDLRCAGAGPTLLAARLASLIACRSSIPGFFAVSSGSVASFLALFPIDLLPSSNSETERLRTLGVRTLGDLQHIPRPLLKAVFGPTGAHLADEACGLVSPPLQRGDEPCGGSVLVVGVCLDRPLTSDVGLSALRRAMAVRALTVCPDGPAGRARWILVSRWSDNGRASASVIGVGSDGTLAAWRGLLEKLWAKLPRRRRGPVRLELRADGRVGLGPRQACLFPADEAEHRLTEALRRIRLADDDSIGPASESLLAAWGACWYGGSSGEGSVVPGAASGMGLVDGPCQDG